VSDVYAIGFAARMAGAGGVVASDLVESGHRNNSLPVKSGTRPVGATSVACDWCIKRSRIRRECRSEE
jgi:hypothetical protein